MTRSERRSRPFGKLAFLVVAGFAAAPEPRTTFSEVDKDFEQRLASTSLPTSVSSMCSTAMGRRRT